MCFAVSPLRTAARSSSIPPCTIFAKAAPRPARSCAHSPEKSNRTGASFAASPRREPSDNGGFAPNLDDTQSCCGALIRPSPWPADVVSTRSVRPRPAARSSLSWRVRIVRRAVAAVLRDREQVSHGAARLFPEPLLEVRSKCPRRSRPPAHVPRADRSEPPAVRP